MPICEQKAVKYYWVIRNMLEEGLYLQFLQKYVVLVININSERPSKDNT